MKKFIGVYDYTVILTYLNLIFAVIGIVFAINHNCDIAILCIFLSGVCDAFDGIVARTKKNRTDDEKNFGIQLDSLCDVISFGFVPGFVCFFMGVNGIMGIIMIIFYVVCALIRLAYFNVLEIKRQKTETGSADSYRGLPVTTISIIFPVIYITKFVLPQETLNIILHIMLAVMGILFITNIKVKKLKLDKLFVKKTHSTL